jgi:hypothetical protein
VEDRTVSFCIEEGAPGGKTAGTGHGENGGPGTDVFNNFGVHNEPGPHCADKF